MSKFAESLQTTKLVSYKHKRFGYEHLDVEIDKSTLEVYTIFHNGEDVTSEFTGEERAGIQNDITLNWM